MQLRHLSILSPHIIIRAPSGPTGRAEHPCQPTGSQRTWTWYQTVTSHATVNNADISHKSTATNQLISGSVINYFSVGQPTAEAPFAAGAADALIRGRCL